MTPDDQSRQNLIEHRMEKAYEAGNIRLLELKKTSVHGKKAAPIERIREMTSSSKSNWSKAVIDERADRL